jgi:hypothetical protein
VQFSGDIFGEAETAGGIFTVDDNEVNLTFAHELGNQGGGDSAAGLREDIGDEKQLQRA